MTIYQQGAKIERDHCKKAISEGALVSLRGAGSKSYGKYKIDTIDIYPDRIILTQHKKKGVIKKSDVADLLKLQKKVPNNVSICVGTAFTIRPVNEYIKILFE